MKNKMQENQDIEISLLLEAIYIKYGYDFRHYSKEHVKRRILHRLSLSGLDNISYMLHKVLYDRKFFEVLLHDFSINVTTMFRDPTFYKSIREKIIPILKTYPFIKIWHAGCSTGEEAYSMAILLKEESLYDKSLIYATDFNKEALKKARSGIYDTDNVEEYTTNYRNAGGRNNLSDYYLTSQDSIIIDDRFKEKIIFADHNLVTDGVFGEMHMIVCRNVLIYFDCELKNDVLKLFYNSLCYGGFLGLGSKESIRFTKYNNRFEGFIEEERIFRKKFGD